ncbi:MAG: ABC transporter permease [Alistipes sp.]|nr:ABC transporter permease [Alistipes sp.]
MFSPKSHSVINVIASVSVLAVAIPTAAMIILMAMFDGLTSTIQQYNRAVDADIEIVPTRGSTFRSDEVEIERIRDIEGVVATTSYIEQSVMASAHGRRVAVSLRGVDSTYCDVISLDQYLVLGDFNSIKRGDIILSATVASELATYSLGAPIELYALNRKQISTLLPTSGISHHKTYLGGEVMTNYENDATLAIGDLRRVQQLLSYNDKLSCIAIKVSEGVDIDRVKQEIGSIVNENLTVQTRNDKNASTNAILRIEKFAILLIGLLIATVATFSIVGTVLMLITEKKLDIATMRAMGASNRLLQRIFVGEGMLLTGFGCVIGTLIGVGFALGQQHFGWIKIPGNMVVECYPVDMSLADVAIINIIMIAIGFVISQLTVRAKIMK